MTAPAFDPEKHRREKIRRLERENGALRQYRQRTEAVLGLACQVIAARQETTPMDVLTVLERIIEESDR